MTDTKNSHEMLDTFFESDCDDITANSTSDQLKKTADITGNLSRAEGNEHTEERQEVPLLDTPQETKGYKPPSFMFVLLIAIVAILFGYILGYITGTMSSKQSSGIINAPASQQGSSSLTQSGSTNGSGRVDEMTKALPEGHPDVRESLETLNNDSK